MDKSNLSRKQLARLQFVTWLKKAAPDVYQQAMGSALRSDATLRGLGEEPAKSVWEKFTDALTGVGTTLLTLKAQKDALKLNLQRAQAGLPPIDTSAVAPTVRTQVDVSPELAQKLIDTTGEGLNKALVWGGLGLLGLMIAKKFKVF